MLDVLYTDCGSCQGVVEKVDVYTNTQEHGCRDDVIHSCLGAVREQCHQRRAIGRQMVNIAVSNNLQWSRRCYLELDVPERF